MPFHPDFSWPWGLKLWSAVLHLDKCPLHPGVWSVCSVALPCHHCACSGPPLEICCCSYSREIVLTVKHLWQCWKIPCHRAEIPSSIPTLLSNVGIEKKHFSFLFHLSTAEVWCLLVFLFPTCISGGAFQNSLCKQNFGTILFSYFLNLKEVLSQKGTVLLQSRWDGTAQIKDMLWSPRHGSLLLFSSSNEN